MNITKIDYKTILPFWKILWPHMVRIPASSSIDIDGIFNVDLKKYKPMFLGCDIDGKLVGVNSVVQTSKNHCRSRGLFVLPSERNKGVGSFLLDRTGWIVRNNGLKVLWSMPRQSSTDFYLKNGFEQISGFFKFFEFGPHCFVIKNVEFK